MKKKYRELALSNGAFVMSIRKPWLVLTLVPTILTGAVLIWGVIGHSIAPHLAAQAFLLAIGLASFSAWFVTSQIRDRLFFHLNKDGLTTGASDSQIPWAEVTSVSLIPIPWFPLARLHSDGRRPSRFVPLNVTDSKALRKVTSSLLPPTHPFKAFLEKYGGPFESRDGASEDSEHAQNDRPNPRHRQVRLPDRATIQSVLSAEEYARYRHCKTWVWLELMVSLALLAAGVVCAAGSHSVVGALCAAAGLVATIGFLALLRGNRRWSRLAYLVDVGNLIDRVSLARSSVETYRSIRDRYLDHLVLIDTRVSSLRSSGSEVAKR